MRFTSITQRFVVWFLLIALLPLLLLSYSLLHTFELELRHTVAKQMSAIADKKADQIDSYPIASLRLGGACLCDAASKVDPDDIS